MQTMNKTKDVFLTKAQFEARKTANTLEEGIIYHTTDETVLTPNGVKTLFGKSILKEPEDNNIDLYRHQIKVSDIRSIIGTFIIISSNNLKIDSLSKLTTVTKATNGYIIDGRVDETLTNVRLTFNGTTWNLEGFTGAFDSITDVVTPL